MTDSVKLEFYKADEKSKLSLPLFSARVQAGFPSPADDYVEKKLDLNELLIAHPAATFFVRVEGNSMINAGIQSGDLLIVDRALTPSDNKIVVAILNGEFTVKRIRKESGKLFLLPENSSFSPLQITPEMDFEVWGVVTFIVHKAS
ncbi:MAG: translesion error-prone DNA polymerase V autoproteolytic subunit [Candidatus Algichlamydia australiensis]|nr:translesion error-prone DNA polymerase V autoproteolytic subunit [Chlamydiales bacterium]